MFVVIVEKQRGALNGRIIMAKKELLATKWAKWAKKNMYAKDFATAIHFALLPNYEFTIVKDLGLKQYIVGVQLQGNTEFIMKWGFKSVAEAESFCNEMKWKYKVL